MHLSSIIWISLNGQLNPHRHTNHNKFKYLIMGTKKVREQTLRELENEPMVMGDLIIKHAIGKIPRGLG